MSDLQTADAVPTSSGSAWGENFLSDSGEPMGKTVYKRLSDALMQGRLQPDERLKIRDVAHVMQTSVTPVRDAVLQLVQEGALVMRSPRDIRVRRVDRKEYLEIRDIRVELEGMAAAAAASSVTAADVAVLKSLMLENERALADGRFLDAVRLNQAFHFEYCRLADMPTLLEILNKLWIKMGPLIAQSYVQGGRDMVDHHYPLIEALLRNDARAARIAVQTDIISGGKSILDTFNG